MINRELAIMIDRQSTGSFFYVVLSGVVLKGYIREFEDDYLILNTPVEIGVPSVRYVIPYITIQAFGSE